jgi:type IV pilus assembly protein PilO
MKLEDFKQIDLKNLGGAPLPVKVVLLTLIFLGLVGGGYWFLWQPALEELDQAKNKETELRTVFMAKKKEAINLPIYKQQMADIERTFGELLRQLPDKTQMEGLLRDVNAAGLEVGLEFDLFRPGAEQPAEFYVTKPISIRVVGSYHQLGAFAQNIAKMPRIVTLEDLTIAPVAGGKEGMVGVNATAKTFRYIEAGEGTGKKNVPVRVSK